MEIKDNLLQLLFPRKCPVCGEILPAHPLDVFERTGRDPYICRECLPYLKAPEGPRCLKCSKPIDDEEAEYCADCASRTRHFDEGMALWVQTGTARKVIYGLKFDGHRDNADFIGFEMARGLGKWILRKDIDVIIPVPLHPKKQKSRGFNQAELVSRKMAYWIDRLYGKAIPVDTVTLRRTLKTRPQKELDPEYRYANIRGAFAAEGNLSGRNVCLLDDIFTTGSTLSEAARELKGAGAEKVYFVTASIGV